MALYYDAAAILSAPLPSHRSLRSRVYDNNTIIKSSPSLVYGLIIECAKWDSVLSEVIDKAAIISHERKLTPLLALFLVHDLLLSKRGIACPRNHPLRSAIERHKARLASELTKARLRRKCATLEALHQHVLAQKRTSVGSVPQPRWVRINNLKTDLNDEIRTTFSTFIECPALDQLCTGAGTVKAYVRDPNIPDVLATNTPTKDIIQTPAYQAGKIILQDKASCFPAYLALKSKPKLSIPSDGTNEGDFLDACAAPGNKASHIASILASGHGTGTQEVARETIVFACERDSDRSKTLQSMLDRAGAHSTVKVLAKQDFLALNPQEQRFSNVTHILLDPSCSGSGIVGREDIPTLVLPNDPKKRAPDRVKVQDITVTGSSVQCCNKKRKRDVACQRRSKNAGVDTPPTPSSSTDTDRLRKLSNLQTQMLEHAFAFPSAKLVTYSTCSVYAVENEVVVLRALNSRIAKRQCWRLLRRNEQADGLRMWPHRGDGLDVEESNGTVEATWNAMTKDEREGFREACIRCRPGGTDGTMGFFVVGFVKDPGAVGNRHMKPEARNGVEVEDDEWEGFSADEENQMGHIP